MDSIKIGLHMIVKEDIDTIETCLRSCKELVDYMVIAVDSDPTSDKTFRLCQKLAGKGAYRQEWKNDFGWARNDSLNKLLELHPETNYVFWLDGDDRLATADEGAASFSEIRNRLEKEQPYVVSSPYVYSVDDLVPGTLPNLQFYRHRFWKHQPKNPPIRIWEGAAHECDVEAGAPRGTLSTSKYGEAVVWKDFIIVHKKEQKKEQKTSRNIQILEDSHKKDPRNTRTMFYLGREYRDSGQLEKSILMLQKYVIQSNFIEEKYDALMNIAYLFRDLKDPQNAEKFAKKAFDLKPELALAPAFLGELYLNYRMVGKAKPWLSYAIHAPHGSILFDEVSARTYVPHKLISKCFLLTRDLENAKRHHKIARDMAPLDMDLRHNDIWLLDHSYTNYPDDYSQIMTFIDSCSQEPPNPASDDPLQETKDRTDLVINKILEETATDKSVLVLGSFSEEIWKKRSDHACSVYVVTESELLGLNNVFLLGDDPSVLKEKQIKQPIKFLLVSLDSEALNLKLLNTLQHLQDKCLVIIENFSSVENNMAVMLRTFKDLHFLRNYGKQLGIGVFLLKKDYQD